MLPRRLVGIAALLALSTLSPQGLVAQDDDPGVTYDDILQGLDDPSRWLTFSGDYSGQRHSPLTQITAENVHRLVPQWTFQTGNLTRGRGFETTPLVLDGVLYVTGSNNYAWALDARTGRRFWQYRRNLPDDLTYGASAPVNRGFGMLGDRLFMVTLDAHLLALDRKTGSVLWEIELADYHIGYAATLAPLVIDGKVIVGISGGEYPTRGFLDAYDPETGERIWRFNTIPGPGEPGSETWPQDGENLARWRRGHVDDGKLRSGPRSALLGHRESESSRRLLAIPRHDDETREGAWMTATIRTSICFTGARESESRLLR